MTDIALAATQLAPASASASLLEAQKHVLEMIVQNRPLPEVLSALCITAESLAPRPVRSSILLVDARTRRLVTGAAPSLPAIFSRALDGIEIAPGIGTCAAAAARREVVITPDIASDPGWRTMAHVPLNLGLRAAWSVPILSAAGVVLGTFGTYFQQKREPLAHERGLVEVLARTAALAIERQRGQEALQASEALHRAMVEASPECVKLVSADGTLLQINTAGLRMVEADSADEVAGRSIYDGIVPEHREQYRDFHERVCRGESAALNFEIVGLRGTRRSMESNAVALNMPGGTRCQLSITRDVTERNANERALAQSHERLAELNARLTEQDRRKDEFLAMLAHELRNPLAPVRSGLYLLQRGGGEEQLARIRDMMDRQLGHLVRMVDDLLDVSRITLGKLVLKNERVDFRAVLHCALEATRPMVEAAGHELAVRLPQQPVLLNADVTRLTQVFANLISNAVRYTPPGGRIQLSAEVHGASLAARVSDTGIGIPGEMLPRIFDLFTQAQPATEHSNGGLGVGLTLARRLIEMHGGSITAESAGVGAGSTFTVSLPLAQGVECNPSLPRARTEADTRHRRILVVDDNIDAAETVALLLAQEGHETRVAHDGETALANAEEFHAEVVLLDLGLPGLSGLEVARRLRRQAHTPESVLLVALTGWGSEEDRRQAQSAGFDRHLVKPVELDKLLEAVRDG